MPERHAPLNSNVALGRTKRVSAEGPNVMVRFSTAEKLYEYQPPWQSSSGGEQRAERGKGRQNSNARVDITNSDVRLSEYGQ
ncbi:hypothetical protein M407DRAFT_170055 [Tulasnella calospora MUT 4182]|uniref:Uncharacterized protein n=1 Tax=Tulasnella calospora MUT 4182 TaxID=1051891 RepID=A0A0C3M706_9AGAM|nr:hypothetical protein M407DRAFT_170055 [Tulasnella calospora MUT 4182]